MNHEQWTALQAATKGHTLRRWHVQWIDQEGGGYYILCGDGGKNPARQALAAAAPDLREEVARLRKHVQLISDNAFRGEIILREFCIDALNGVEVPE